MASYALTTTVFPDGTSVGAYPETNWPNAGPHSGAPVGAATSTQTVSGGALEFTGLIEGVTYNAVAEVGGRYRYITFSVPSVEEGESGGGVDSAAVEAILEKKIGTSVMAQNDPRLVELFEALAGAFVPVYYGENANTPRPPDATHVLWIGLESITPVNAIGYKSNPAHFDCRLPLAALPS